MKKEGAATEVVGFVIVLSIIILGIVIWTVIALPIQGENKEITHNDDVLHEMADFKYNLDTLMIDHITYSTRTCFVSNSPKGDKAVVTLLPEISTLFSFGTVTMKTGEYLGDGCSRLVVTFNSHNMYAEDIELVYDGGSLYSGGHPVLSEVCTWSYGGSKFISAVPSSFQPIILSGNEFSVFVFRLDDVKYIGDNRVGVFSVDVKGS